MLSLVLKKSQILQQRMIPVAEKINLICHTYYRITLEVLKGSKGTAEVGKGRGSQVPEGKTEKFSKHLKEKQPILNM